MPAWVYLPYTIASVRSDLDGCTCTIKRIQPKMPSGVTCPPRTIVRAKSNSTFHSFLIPLLLSTEGNLLVTIFVPETIQCSECSHLSSFPHPFWNYNNNNNNLTLNLMSCYVALKVNISPTSFHSQSRF